MVLVDIIVWTIFSFAILGLLLIFLGYYLRHAQDLLLYHPDNPPNSTVSCDAPQSWNIRNSERVEVVTADGVTLAGYFMKCKESGLLKKQNNNSNSNDQQQQSPDETSSSSAAAAASSSSSSSPSRTENNNNNNNNNKNKNNNNVPPTLVYFHGNAGNVGHRLPIAKYLMDQAKVDVLMCDYRAFGLSDAVRPCEVGIQLDGIAVMDYIETKAAPGSKIIVMGVSLGGAVALFLSSHRKYRHMIDALILENTFCGISEMADSLFHPIITKKFPHFGGTVLSWTLRKIIKPLVIQIHWRSIDRVPQVVCPILFLSGLADELVPPSHMQDLFEAASRAPLKRMICFEGGKHNDLCSKDGFFQHIGRFADYVSKKSKTE